MTWFSGVTGQGWMFSVSAEGQRRLVDLSMQIDSHVNAAYVVKCL